jgi:L-alanine-DL-glutamate epimerase-like enolase superfamily enzyme
VCIADLVTETFTYPSRIARDAEGHAHPGPETQARQPLLRAVTDQGVEGYSFGVSADVIQRIVKPMLVGQDPFYRERIWQIVKTAHLCESFGVRMEVHGNGAANLQVLCVMGIPGEFYERGLLHPFLDYEQPSPWLHALDDPLDAQGYVHVSDRPGLGQDINFDYICKHRQA